MGIIQDQQAIAEHLDKLGHSTDERFKNVDDGCAYLSQRVSVLEGVLGMTSSGCGGGEPVPAGRFDGSRPGGTGVYGGFEEENNVRLRRLEDRTEELHKTIAELRQLIFEMRPMAAKGEAKTFSIGVWTEDGPQEIPKRQNPPPAVRKAAQEAADARDLTPAQWRRRDAERRKAADAAKAPAKPTPRRKKR